MEKELKMFYVHQKTKDGYSTSCKDCHKKQTKEYRRTFDGLVTEIYSFQKTGQSFKVPKYSKIELKQWCLNDTNFINLFKEWELSNYHTDKRPTIDRIDSFKGYSFENIQSLTFSQNVQKEYNDRIIGKSRNLKSVIQYDLNGDLINEFFSIQEASRQTNSSQSHIGSCCNGKRKSHNGFIWKFKNDTI